MELLVFNYFYLFFQNNKNHLFGLCILREFQDYVRLHPEIVVVFQLLQNVVRVFMRHLKIKNSILYIL